MKGLTNTGITNLKDTELSSYTHILRQVLMKDKLCTKLQLLSHQSFLSQNQCYLSVSHQVT